MANYTPLVTTYDYVGTYMNSFTTPKQNYIFNNINVYRNKKPILFVIKKLISFQSTQIDFTNIRDHRAYKLPVKYTKKSFVD